MSTSQLLHPKPAVTKRRHLRKRYDVTKPSSQQDVLKSSTKSLHMIAGSFYIPKKNELKPLGEDAHFVCEEKRTIGLADGVGGWSKKGVDAGEYARELMRNCFLAVEDQPKGAIDPFHVLNKAYLDTEALGSSTACIITLTGDVLHAENLGDSGFVVIRAGHIIYRSPVQQSRFNCPFQLGNTTCHGPRSAMKIAVEVEDGDIVIAGTDGLFDNVHLDEIEDLVNMPREDGEMPDLLAWTIARFASVKSLDKSCFTPFQRVAIEAGHPEFVGGKYDDISVIVAYIVA
ncbi:hypothetical protein RJ639_045937 [Escallonia herrerae]|uniref:Protein phosphatase n=1 Tax=Escallonia herrerae TaxID=1293975 RepID=A0AA89B0U7_9ASTE|nr:hypothetical protein RJ639_045937 [Escallonia herrerae]